MRNLILASIVLACAGTAVIYQRAALARIRDSSAQLTQENDALAKRIQRESARIAELEQRKTNRTNELYTARASLQQHNASKSIPVTELTAQAEGHWPAQRPYFYLAKKHIPNVGYTAFKWDGSLSKEGAALFGMTAQEQRAINNNIDLILSHLRSKESREAHLTNTPAWVEAQRSGKKTSIFLPGHAELELLQQEFAQQAHTILGPERAALLLDRFKQDQQQFDSFSGKDRVVTIIPKDEHSGEIIISSDGGTSYNYYDFLRNDFMRTQYGHLLEQYVPAASSEDSAR